VWEENSEALTPHTPSTPVEGRGVAGRNRGGSALKNFDRSLLLKPFEWIAQSLLYTDTTHLYNTYIYIYIGIEYRHFQIAILNCPWLGGPYVILLLDGWKSIGTYHRL